MKGRALQGHNAVLGAALVLSLILGSVDSQAGVFRDVLSSMHLSKPDAPSEAPPSVPWQGFACCNLHYDGTTIDDGNHSELSMIPAGTPIQVLSYNDGRHRAEIKVDGKPMNLGLEYGREQESLEAWVAKIVVTTDPRPRINSYPTAIRDAIYEGKVMVGMTREQALVSIGYPMANVNLILDGPVWRLWYSRHSEYQLNFRQDGHLNSVTGDDEVTTHVLYRPAP